MVVETFGCDTPEPYVLAMAARTPHPRWINLEYLSAEEWVEGSHALPVAASAPCAAHAALLLPGLHARAPGGLLRERGPPRAARRLPGRPRGQAAFWRGSPAPPPDGALKVSVFGYPGAPYESLLDAMKHHAGPVWVVAPEGAASAAVTAWLHGKAHGERSGVEAFVVPFLDQDRYDELLWACDLNFVRGEDSFVRAQWAARPFVWHIYPTDDGAHWVKLEAFLARYTAGMDRAHAACVTACGRRGTGARRLARRLAGLRCRRWRRSRPHAEDWAARLAAPRGSRRGAGGFCR